MLKNLPTDFLWIARSFSRCSDEFGDGLRMNSSNGIFVLNFLFGIRPKLGGCPGKRPILGGCPGAAGFLVSLTTDSYVGWLGENSSRWPRPLSLFLSPMSILVQTKKNSPGPPKRRFYTNNGSNTGGFFFFISSNPKGRPLL